MLDCHSKAIVPTEYPVLLRILSKSGNRNFRTPKQKHWIINQFVGLKHHHNRLFDTLGLNESQFRVDIINHTSDLTTETAFKAFISNCRSARLEGKPFIVGDKNPVYSFYIRTLMRKFPEAKFVFIIRDPRDQFVSVKKFDFEANSPVLQGIRWKMVVKNMKWCLKMYPERTMMLKYEDLVHFPPEVLTDICKFLGVEFQDEMLEFYRNVDAGLGEKERTLLNVFHEKLSSPVNDASVDQWKTKLSLSEIQGVEKGAGRWISEASYQPFANKIKFRIQLSFVFWSAHAIILNAMMNAILWLPAGKRFFLIRMINCFSKIYFLIFCKVK